MIYVGKHAVTTPTFDPASIEDLATGLGGDLIQPGDRRYDDTRKIWNGMIDKRPALIVRCTGVADVIKAVNFAREQGTPPSIRGGGHNVAGHAVSDGGLMIDLSLMRSVHVNPARQTATVEGGATWADFDRETAVFGLATTGGVISSTGVAGLTLGGGIGWLVGKYGLTVDNLLAVELVTADGNWIRTSKDEHPDLFWALRGGGGNFGIATSFEFQLHPVSFVFSGMFAWPASESRAVASFFKTFTETNPEEMTTYLQFFRDEESGERMVGLAIFYPGDVAEGERLADEIRAFKAPLIEMVGAMPYRDWQTAADPEFPYGARYYWKGTLLSQLDEAAVAAVAEFGARPEPESSMLLIEHYRGAMNRISVESTAFPHRDARYQVVATGKWYDPSDDERGIAWARRVHATLEPYSTKARFLNFSSLDIAEKPEVVRTSFGQNYARLVEVKRRYDPTNLFRENNNIPPE